jgi:serine/threonine-protein kinase
MSAVSIATINTEPFIGMQVGTATITEELARGGMAIVFVAFQRTLKRKIALKVLPKSLLTPETADLFQQEAEAAAILAHPNIIPVYEVGETDEFLFFTMQLVEGNTLAEYLKAAEKNIIPSKRILPLPITLKLIIQVLDALDYAHRQDIVHRDIKPGNVLIEKHSQRPLITDFGIVQIMRSKDDSKPIVHGTPLYMPPEQVLGRNVDGRADIYATGTVLFQMLVKELPLPAFKSKLALLKQKLMQKDGIYLKKPSEVNPNLHEDMDRIVAKALAYDPSERYPTGADFQKDLENYSRKHLP